MNRAECEAACRLHKKVGEVPAHSIESSIGQAVRQVVFTNVLIVGRLDVHGQSCAPIGLHKTDAASDWLVQKACRVFSYKTNRIT